MAIKKGDDVKISTMKQVAELTKEQFLIFVEDLKGWHKVVKKLQFMKDYLTDELAESVKFDDSFIHWVYDDKGNADIGIEVTDEKGNGIKSRVNIPQKDIK